LHENSVSAKPTQDDFVFSPNLPKIIIYPFVVVSHQQGKKSYRLEFHDSFHKNCLSAKPNQNDLTLNFTNNIFYPFVVVFYNYGKKPFMVKNS